MKKRENSALLELIGCADKLLSFNGEMGIYQDTFEKLSFKVKSMSETGTVSRPVDDGLDMFAGDDSGDKSPAEASQHTTDKGNCNNNNNNNNN